jgi:hypothetical protein
LVVLFGCRTFEKPKFDVADRRILLVPFRDLALPHGHGYGESPRGRRVIENFRHWTEKNFEPRFADGEAVVRALREWTKEKITSKDWQRLLMGIDADMVLLGDIVDLKLKDPRAIGFYKGSIVARYSLIDARTGRVAYPPTEVKQEWPPPKDLDVPFLELSTKPEEIETGLLRVVAEQVGKDLFGYYSEK